MTDDIRRYRDLLEAAMHTTEATHAVPQNDLHKDAADAAELLVHVLHASGKDKHMDRMVHDALKNLHGESYGHHDWRTFGKAVLDHAHEMIQTHK